MYQLFVTNEQLKELDLNHYNTSSFVSTDNGEVYTIEDFIEFREMYDNGQNFYYCINWKNDSLYTENGTKIEPVY